MSKRITKAFKVDPEAWANFVRSAEFYGATPAELLRELVGHIDAVMKGIESGRIRSFNGDVSRLIRAEFPTYPLPAAHDGRGFDASCQTR